MKRRSCLTLLLAWPLAACVTGPGQFAKSDIDRVADLHRREIQAGLQRLAEKLYKRNPREWKKGGHASLDAAVSSLLHLTRNGRSPEPAGRRSTTLLLAGLQEDYPHDRVAAFVGGLATMLHDAFGGKTEFFFLDELDPQKLYNAARNVETAAWKLANARQTQATADIPAGSPLLFANEMAPVPNLSFEREFGRMIGNLDVLWQIAADKTQRMVVKVAQSLAAAVFLPI